MQATDVETTFKLLGRPIRLELSLNDLRIMVGCFRAVAYFMKNDDEPYLDADALELHKKLECSYHELLEQAENRRASQDS